jgi:hypothetical protein
MLITGKPHISFSELKDWKECSFRHKLKYIDQLIIGQMNTAVCFGSAIHEACENFLKTRIMNVQVCFDALQKLWEENSHIKEFNESSLAEAKKDSEDILNDIPDFLNENFPNWELVDAEKELYVEIKEYKLKTADINAYFKGYIDGILKVKDSKGNEQFWILDWKTSNFGWKPEKKQHPDTKLQLVLYKHYFSMVSNIPLKNIRCGYVILKKKFKPGKKCELFSISIGETPIENSLTIVKNMLSSLEKGIAIKNRLSCHYCDYYMTDYCK